MKQWWGIGFLAIALWAIFQKRDRLPGGLADDYGDDEFDSDSLEEGSAVELEHTDDIALAREIAKDHLVEDRNYYKKLATIEGKRNPGRYIHPKATGIREWNKYIESLTVGPEEDLVDDILYQELGLKYRKNPVGRCFYTAIINFKRGGKSQRKTISAEAWSISEAHKKFRDLINRNLRDATLEGLHIERTSC